MSTYETAQLLAQQIKDSEEFQDFLKVKDKIASDKDGNHIIQAFKVKQLEIQQAQLFQLNILEEKQQELESIYSLLSLNPAAREYVEAEFRISRMISEIQRIIGEVFEDVLSIEIDQSNTKTNTENTEDKILS